MIVNVEKCKRFSATGHNKHVKALMNWVYYDKSRQFLQFHYVSHCSIKWGMMYHCDTVSPPQHFTSSVHSQVSTCLTIFWMKSPQRALVCLQMHRCQAPNRGRAWPRQYICTSFWNTGFQLQICAQPVNVSSYCGNSPGKLFAFKQSKQKLLWLYADNTPWEKSLSTRTSYCSVMTINSFKSGQLH